MSLWRRRHKAPQKLREFKSFPSWLASPLRVLAGCLCGKQWVFVRASRSADENHAQRHAAQGNEELSLFSVFSLALSQFFAVRRFGRTSGPELPDSDVVFIFAQMTHLA
jgi:hypothetical protein